MTPEERHERIQRILEQVAQELARLRASLQPLSRQLVEQKKTHDNMDQLRSQVQRLDDAMASVQRALEEQRRRPVESNARLDAALKRLAESQARSDARFKAFMKVVERYSEGRKPEG